MPIYNFCGIDNYTDKIYKHSGFSSTIIDSFSSPSNLPMGLACDGVNIISADYGANKIYKHSGFSSSITSSFSWGDHTYDLAWDGSNLLSIVDSSNLVWKHSGFSVTITDSFSVTGAEFTGVTWDGTNVISADDSNMKIYKHSGFSSTITDSFGEVRERGNLGWYGTNLYMIHVGDDQYDRMVGFSGTVGLSINDPGGNPSGLTWGLEDYSDSGIRIREGAVNQAIACDTLSGHKVRCNRMGTVVGIILVATSDAKAAKTRVNDGSSVKSLRKYP